MFSDNNVTMSVAVVREVIVFRRFTITRFSRSILHEQKPCIDRRRVFFLYFIGNRIFSRSTLLGCHLSLRSIKVFDRIPESPSFP